MNFQVNCPLHYLQQDSISCGVFVCYYAHQIVHNYDVNLAFNILKFRKYIYDTLCRSLSSVFDPSLNNYQSSKTFNCFDLNFNVENMSECILKVNGMEITLYMLKSLDTSITLEEELFIQSISGIFKKGCLYGTIIDAFLYRISVDVQGCECLTFDQSESFIKDKRKVYQYFPKIKDANLCFIPFNVNSHWLLIIIDFKNLLIEYYDPLDVPIPNNLLSLLREWATFLTQLLNPLYD